MIHSRWNLFSRRSRRGLALVCVLVFAGAVPLLAQNTAPHDPPAGDRNTDRRVQPALTEPELRKRARENISKRLENRRREIDRLEQALKMLDAGKSWDEVRAAFPDLPHPDSAPANQGLRQGNNEPQRALTPEERETARQFLKDTAPRVLDRLKQLEQTKPGEADTQYAETLRRAKGFLDLRKRDPQMYELRARELRHGRQAMEFAQAIADMKNPDPESADYQAKFGLLHTALTEQYHVRTQIMQREADRMAKDVGARVAQSDEAIDENAHELIERERERRQHKGQDGEHRPGDGRKSGPEPMGDRNDGPPVRP